MSNQIPFTESTLKNGQPNLSTDQRYSSRYAEIRSRRFSKDQPWRHSVRSTGPDCPWSFPSPKLWDSGANRSKHGQSTSSCGLNLQSLEFI